MATPLETATAKLSPSSIRCSGRFTALLGLILRQDWTEPRIHSAAITSDGFLVTESEFFGDASELTKNLRGVAETAGLSEAETAALFTAARARIANYHAA